MQYFAITMPSEKIYLDIFQVFTELNPISVKFSLNSILPFLHTQKNPVIF